MPTPMPGLPPPTLASAVPRGDGEGWRSFCGPTDRPSLSDDKDTFKDIGGAGEEDFRVIMGIIYGATIGADDMEVVRDGGERSVVVAGVGETNFEVDATGVGADMSTDLLESFSVLVVGVEDSTSLAEGLLNSTGLTRGVA